MGYAPFYCDNIEIRLDDKEYHRILSGEINDMLESHITYLQELIDRKLLLNEEIGESAVQKVYYKGTHLWCLCVMTDLSLQLSIDIALLLLVEKICVSDVIKELLITKNNSSLYMKVSGNRIADVCYGGDIEIARPAMANLTKGSFRCLLRNNDFDYLGYMYEYSIAGHSLYKKPGYRIGFCEELHIYIYVELEGIFDDILDWLKDTKIKNLKVSLEFSHSKDKKNNYYIPTYCYEKLYNLAIGKYNKGLTCFDIEAVVYNDTITNYSYVSFEHFSRNISNDLAHIRKYFTKLSNI